MPLNIGDRKLSQATTIPFSTTKPCPKGWSPMTGSTVLLLAWRDGRQRRLPSRSSTIGLHGNTPESHQGCQLRFSTEINGFHSPPANEAFRHTRWDVFRINPVRNMIYPMDMKFSQPLGSTQNPFTRHSLRLWWMDFSFWTTSGDNYIPYPHYNNCETIIPHNKASP